MRKTFEEPIIDVIKFTMNETVTTDNEVFAPDFSVGVEEW